LRVRKNTSELATYLAFFSVTYLATSLKLAKFSITEHTADVENKKNRRIFISPKAKAITIRT